jgi:hypothetical protein
LNIEILIPVRLRQWCERIDLPVELVDELAEVAEQIMADAVLLKIFSEFHETTAIPGKWYREWADLAVDERVQAILGERTSMFYLLGYLSALPYVHAEYQRRGIDDQVFHDTMLDFKIYAGEYHDQHGHWGFHNFRWVWRHLTGELFRLGRLQYVLKAFEDGVTAFRHKGDGQVLLLADPALPLRADGYALGAGKWKKMQPAANQEESEEYSWLAEFEARQDGWWGNPVSPYGFVIKSKMWLPRGQWELMLQHGDAVVDVHIPRKDPLTEEACRDSLRQADAFFRQQYPERQVRAVFCHTWFFTRQLQDMLPAQSNIVRFQREFYLYPHAGSAEFLWEFVFGDRYSDIASAPRDNSLKRAVLDWLADGKELFDLPGVLFHPAEEWGTQPYMGRWDSSATRRTSILA